MRPLEIAPKDKLGLEILEILYSKLLLNELMPESESSLDNLRTMKLAHALHDDIVLRLCKLTDRSRRSNGARAIFRKLRRFSKNGDHVRQIKRALDHLVSFTAILEPYRNARIAHICERSLHATTPLPRIGGAIEAAVALVDVLTETRNEYRILDLDLRVAILGEAERPDTSLTL